MNEVRNERNELNDPSGYAVGEYVTLQNKMSSLDGFYGKIYRQMPYNGWWLVDFGNGRIWEEPETDLLLHNKKDNHE